MATLGAWSNEGGAGCCYHGKAATHFKDCLKIQWFLCADDAGLALGRTLTGRGRPVG